MPWARRTSNRREVHSRRYRGALNSCRLLGRDGQQFADKYLSSTHVRLQLDCCVELGIRLESVFDGLEQIAENVAGAGGIAVLVMEDDLGLAVIVATAGSGLYEGKQSYLDFHDIDSLSLS